MVKGVDQLASGWDVVDRQLRESVARCLGAEVAPAGLSKRLHEDVVFDRLGGQPGLLSRQSREALYHFLDHPRGSKDFYVICNCEKNPPFI